MYLSQSSWNFLKNCLELRVEPHEAYSREGDLVSELLSKGISFTEGLIFSRLGMHIWGPS